MNYSESCLCAIFQYGICVFHVMDMVYVEKQLHDGKGLDYLQKWYLIHE